MDLSNWCLWFFTNNEAIILRSDEMHRQMVHEREFEPSRVDEILKYSQEMMLRSVGRLAASQDRMYLALIVCLALCCFVTTRPSTGPIAILFSIVSVLTVLVGTFKMVGHEVLDTQGFNRFCKIKFDETDSGELPAKAKFKFARMNSWAFLRAEKAVELNSLRLIIASLVMLVAFAALAYGI